MSLEVMLLCLVLLTHQCCTTMRCLLLYRRACLRLPLLLISLLGLKIQSPPSPLFSLLARSLRLNHAGPGLSLLVDIIHRRALAFTLLSIAAVVGSSSSSSYSKTSSSTDQSPLPSLPPPPFFPPLLVDPFLSRHYQKQQATKLAAEKKKENKKRKQQTHAHTHSFFLLCY